MVNKELYVPVMKNLAAFMNSAGGVLLIGIDDDGEVLGLAKDLSTLPKSNVDGFENVFNQAFNKMIGVEFRQYIDVTFPDVRQETICMISVRPSPSPAYMVHKGEEKFYIRAGNATQALTVSKATKYIQGHFDD
jgi:predicted HTH transcriptional regulator